MAEAAVGRALDRPDHPTRGRVSLWPRGLSLRARRPEDVTPLFRLFSQSDVQRNASTLDPLTSPEDAGAVLGRSGPGVFEAVAAVDDLVVGFAGLYAFAGRQRHVGCCTLAVHEAFQRQGVGTALLQALLATGRGFAGLDRLQLTVFVDNARAISLYRRHGFQVEGRLRRFVKREDGFIDAYLMAHDGLTDRAGVRFGCKA